MQIDFTAKKLKEANEYVNKLEPTRKKKTIIKAEVKNTSVLKKIIKFLFR